MPEAGKEAGNEADDKKGESLAVPCVAELTGTFILVLTVGAAVRTGDATFNVTAIACSLMVSIYALGSVSGANFNPAVTLALMITKKGGQGSINKGIAYMVAQVVGGILAASFNCLIMFDPINLEPGPGASWWQAGLAEIIYTFMLCFVVLNVACSIKHEGQNEFYGMAIGFVIVAGGYAAGHLSGGAFNPAVAIALDLSSINLGFGWCLAYTLFEFIGAGAAAMLFKVVRPEDSKDPPPTPETLAPATMSSCLTSEFLGTYMLVLTVGLNVLGGSAAPVWSIAAALMCMIYALGTVSGAHFNPAVTTAIFISKRPEDHDKPKSAPVINFKKYYLYVLAQLAGGLAGAVTYVVMKRGERFPLGPGSGYLLFQAMMAEFFFTFLLCFVVLSVATVKNSLSHYFGLAIGSCVTTGGYAIGAISGGSLNPAVSFGIAVTGIDGVSTAMHCMAYMLTEVAAGAAAAGLFKVVYPGEKYGESELGADVEDGGKAK